MLFTEGEKLLLITRRLFEGDLRRHFVGEVLKETGAAVKVSGYLFLFDDTTKEFERREKVRTRIFSLIDAGIITIVLPKEIVLADLFYAWDEKKRRILTDGKDFRINISEFGLHR